MAHVLGLDASTQSFSAVILDTVSGRICGEASVNFGAELPDYNQPNGYDPTGQSGEVHANPLMWLEALDLLLARMAEDGVDLGSIDAVSGSGQQHGSVYLNQNFGRCLAEQSSAPDLKTALSSCFSRPSAPIWMDSSTKPECSEIADTLGSTQIVCQRSGSIPIERFTGPQIRKFFKNDRSAYAQTEQIHLVSSFFASVLSGRSVAIDHGDGAGMNLMNLAAKDWDPELLSATAEGLAEKLPPCRPSGTVCGKISSYFVEKYGFNKNCQTILWSGDNPCSLVGMGAASPGEVVISLGTSDTLFAAMDEPLSDPKGYGHVFGNPLGGYMSLICFKNGSLAREAIKDAFGLDWSAFEIQALARTEPGNDGLMMLPFYEPEITPTADTNGPVYSDEREISAEAAARAVLEGQFLNMRTHAAWMGLAPKRISLTGGASQNDGIAQIVADIFGLPVDRLNVPGSAAVGAAIRAAVAIGHNREALEADFCRAEPGRTIEPNTEARARYDAILPVFQSFLEKHVASPASQS